jgi:arylsulfatase A
LGRGAGAACGDSGADKVCVTRERVEPQRHEGHDGSRQKIVGWVLAPNAELERCYVGYELPTYEQMKRFYLFLAFFASLAVHSNANERDGRPNVVLIVADDLGYGELGCYGQKIIETPRLDELAREGVRFTQFYSGAPVCAPSRCVLMTGKHSGHAAIRDNRKPTGRKFAQLNKEYEWKFPGQQPLPDGEVTLAELLKSRGYATGAMGKWGLGQIGTSGDPSHQGFDLFYGYLCQVHAHNHYPKFLWRNDKKELLPGNDAGATGETYSQDKFTEEALKFIREHQDEPFFLYLPFVISHLAIQVPESSLAQYRGKIEETPYKHAGSYHEHPSPHAGYAAMVSHMDRDIGRIVDLIEALGLAEDTIFIFTSDNGPTYGRLGGADSNFFNSSGPLRGRKGSVYEGGIRVPLIVSWPGAIPAGRVSDHVGAFWDVVPTLCEIAGAATPRDVDGISFAPMLTGKAKQREHEFLYWEFPAYGVQQAVRAGDWKIVRDGVDRNESEFELYNLGTDIAEQHDVAEENPDVVRRLSEMARMAHSPSRLFPLLASEKDRE